MSLPRYGRWKATAPLMKKRSATRSPLEVEEVGSSSGKAVGEIEVDPVSHSVSQAEAEAAEASSPPPVFTFGVRWEVEQVDSRSRLEVDPVFRGACPPAL